MTFSDLIPIYDFSLWEKAIQAYFCDATAGGGLFVAPPDEHDATRETWTPDAGRIAFFTAFQNAIFQKARPRVSLSPISYTPMNEGALIVDANGRLENRGYNVPLEFYVVTTADYALHTQTLATVRAIVSQMNPVISSLSQIESTGLNAFLTKHELAKIWDAGNSLATGITPDKGAYVTPIKYNALFAVRAASWPGGFNQ